MNEKKKIVMEILEEDEEPEIKPGSQYCKDHPDDPRCKEHQKAIHGEQITQVIPVEVPTKKSMEPDEHGQCEPGFRLNALGKCIETEECGENMHWDANANGGQGGCVEDSVPKPEGPETAVGTSPAPREDVLSDAPTEQPKPEEQPPVTGTGSLPPAPAAGEQPAVTGHPPEPEEPMKPTEPATVQPKDSHDCGDGYHYDYDANQCVPDEPIVERVKRIKAENRAKNAEEAAANWELHYMKVNQQYNVQTGVVKEQARSIKELRERMHNDSQRLNEKRLKLEGELNDERRETGRLHSEIRGLREQLDRLKTHSDELSGKYQNAVSVNLELSRKNVKANEDYLEAAARIEYLEAQLNKAKDIGRKLKKLKTEIRV